MLLLNQAVIIRPDKVQVNTVTRPPAENSAERVADERLKVPAVQLSNNAEVIADYNRVHKQNDFSARLDDILALLKRRPCSIEDIAAGRGLHENEVIKYVEELSRSGRLVVEVQNKQLYYKAKIHTGYVHSSSLITAAGETQRVCSISSAILSYSVARRIVEPWEGLLDKGLRTLFW